MRLEVKNLSFSYDVKNVLKNISFELEDGDFAVVLGPNGSGKSTLFKCLLNRLPNYDGSVIIDGKSVKDMSHKTTAKLMAYIPQTFGNIYDYTVMETVMFGMAGFMNIFEAPKKEQEGRCIEALRKVGMEEFYDRPVNKLSGGEKQMVYIARALVQNSKMLIMDEPTSALDFGNRFMALECIYNLSKEGYIILTSTHDPQQALKYANKTFAIKNGKLLAAGDTGTVINENLLTELYGHEIRIKYFDNQKLVYIP